MIINSDNSLSEAIGELRAQYGIYRYLKITIKKGADRTVDQNSKMWAMLTDISNQVEWPVDGELKKLSADDWKSILSAGLKKNQRVAKGVEGGFVMLGISTSKMLKSDMIELVEFIQWFGDEHSVQWDERNKI